MTLLLPLILLPRVLVVEISQQLKVSVLVHLGGALVGLLVSLHKLLLQVLDGLGTITHVFRNLDHALSMVELSVRNTDVITDLVNVHALQHIWLVMLLIQKFLHLLFLRL